MSDELKPLPPDVLALLDEERAAPGAPSGARERVRGRVYATLGAGAAGAAAGTTTAHATPALGQAALPGAAGVAGKALFGKLVLGALAVAGLGAAITFGVRAMRSDGASPLLAAPAPQMAPATTAPLAAPALAAPPSPTPIAAPAAAPIAAPAAVAPGAAPAAAAPAAAAPAAGESRSLSHGEAARARIKAHKAAKDSGDFAGSDGDLAGERVLLENARHALAGAAADALTAIEQHARRYPRGQLVEERESLRIRALAATHRDSEARARAAQFRSRFPHSLFLPVVEHTIQSLP